MPTLPRLFLRTGILFLVLGVLTGLHMSSALHLRAGVMHYHYGSAHTHVLLIGFLLSTLVGVALWKLPEAPGESTRAFERLAYFGITLGTAARFLTEVVLGYFELEWMHALVFATSCVQALGILAACSAIWPRLRS